MNSTPPIARRTTSWTFIAVWPTYAATRSARDASTSWPPADDADRPVEARDEPRDRCLARPGIAREHDVVAGLHLGEALGAPLGVEALDGNELADVILLLDQADQ